VTQPHQRHEIDWGATPRVAEVRQLFRTRYPLFADAVDRVAHVFGDDWARDFDGTLCRVFPDGEALPLAVKGYVRFALDILRRQKRFEVERTYPPKTYAEAADEVYLDETYMASEYLPGLLLSHFLWPHHYHQLRFFDGAFVDHMRVAGATRFIEVGVGTGIYSRRVLQRLPDLCGRGFDISPAAKSFTESHVESFGFGRRYGVTLGDITVERVEAEPWLICVEVLEHLEDPTSFLSALRQIVAPGGHAFITAALNAPHVDHIYLYERPGDVVDQLEATGFSVEQGFLGVAYKPAKPKVPVPAVVAFVVG
jgi:SAM-dependent methyltransferase